MIESTRKRFREEEHNMESKVQQILADIENYKEAIEDARNALAAAEQELDEELEKELEQER